jgi:phage-related protein
MRVSGTPILSVKFYKSPTGNEPVREWLLSLQANDRKNIGIDIKTVQYGWPIGMPLVEKIERGLWEIRSNGLSFGITRIFFTIEDNMLILLHAIIKKTNKVPQADLELARKRLTDVRG